MLNGVIVILDNGADYSSHEILFVQCPRALVPHVKTCWMAMPGDFYKPSVVAVVESVDWLGTPPMTVAEIVGRYDSYFEAAEDAYLALLEDQSEVKTGP